MGTGAAVGYSIHREHLVFERTTTGHREVAIVPLVSRAGAGLRRGWLLKAVVDCARHQPADIAS
jgi:hypothetical protein